jgi:thioredoxin-dependent peroxiredoxin
MLKEGEKAPDFDLESSTGGRMRLKDLRGAPVVVYFYPRDMTPGCTREACDFQDARRRLAKAGATVVGVSPDSVVSHKKFASAHGLKFPLLADPEAQVAKAYGAYGDKVLYGRKIKGMIRSTFVIDDKGVIRKVFPKVRVDGHAEKVLEALAEI